MNDRGRRLDGTAGRCDGFIVIRRRPFYAHSRLNKIQIDPSEQWRNRDAKPAGLVAAGTVVIEDGVEIPGDGEMVELYPSCEALSAATREIVADLYANRGDEADIVSSVAQALLAPYRVFKL